MIIIAAENFKFNICFATADEIGDDTVRYYWPLLSDERKKEISDMITPEDRRFALACEVAARQALAGFSGIPEEEIDLECTPDGQYFSEVVPEFLTVKKAGNIVCAAACSASVGLGLSIIVPFDFASAQHTLSDSEIRTLMAVSGCSLMDMVNSGECSVHSATEFYAKLCALKYAKNECFPEKERKAQSSIVFDYSSNEFTSKSPDCDVIYCTSDKKYGFAAALVGRKG